jgi:hypothetical protein
MFAKLHTIFFVFGAWAVSQFDWVFPCLVQNNTQQLPFSSLLYARVITTATTSKSEAVPASHLEIDMLLVAWNTCFLQLYSAWFPLKDFTLMLLQEDKSSLGILLLFCFCKVPVETQKSKSLCALLLLRESRVHFLCFYLSFVPDPMTDTREIRCRFCFL